MRKNPESVSLLLHIVEEMNVNSFVWAGSCTDILDYLTSAIVDVLIKSGVNEYSKPENVIKITQNIGNVIFSKICEEIIESNGRTGEDSNQNKTGKE